MKTETKHTILFVILFAALAGAGYYAYTQLSKKTISKSDKVVAILSMSGGTGDYNTLMGLGDEYINDWYKAVIAKNTTFNIGNQTFCTVTGKSV